MEISPYYFTLLLLYSFLFGAAVGVLNDLHRLTRIFLGVRYSKKRFARLYTLPLPFVKRSVGEIGTGRWRTRVLPVWIFFQDVFLFVFAAVGVAVLNYYFNHGQFRVHTVIAVLFGFLAYYFTVGKGIMLVSEGILCLLRMATVILLFLLGRPFVLVGRFVIGIAKKIHRKIGKALANRRKKVYNKYMVDRALKEAESGFLSTDGKTKAKEKIV